MSTGEATRQAPEGRPGNPEPDPMRAPRPIRWPCILAIIALFPCLAGAVENQTGPLEFDAYQSKKLQLGIGFGIVSFDSKVKVRDKQSGGRRFLDLEGNLDLPETDRVNMFYGAYDFNARHSLVYSYFGTKRDSVVRDIEANFDDVILISATVEVEDKSRFFHLGYGYNLFRDDRSTVTAVVGVNFLDMKLVSTATGDLTVDGVTSSYTEISEADVLAPLPLIGLNFSFSFTPKWGISTQIAVVDGTYEGTSATAWHTTINSVYRLSSRTGFLLGITSFDTSVQVDEDDEITDVQYGYSGLFAGVHVGF